MMNRFEWNRAWSVWGLLLLVWSGCDLGTSLASGRLPEKQAFSSRAPVAVEPGSGRERHCELILLNPSPAPIGDESATEAVEVAKPTSDVSRSDRLNGATEEPPRVKEFRRLHREIPAVVVQALRTYHLRNYSVHIAQIREDYYAVRYFEYTGDNFALDLASLEHDPDYRQWRDQWEACQITLLPLSAEQWWAPLDEIGHVE